jgi:poly(beta-D-mannuronate) lyase
VLLTGESSLLIGGQWLVVDGLLFTDGYVLDTSHVIQFRISSQEAEDCRLTNTAIINYNPPDPTERYFWVSMYGHRNRIDHCYFSGQNHDGVTLVVWHDGTVNDHRIDHNHFANHAYGNGANGWETIRVGTSEFSLSNSRTLVEHNLFEACDGEIEIISNKSCENIYRANTFLRSKGMLTIRHGNRCVVEGNTFLGEHVVETGGIRVIGEDHVIINNLIQETDGRDGAAITLYEGETNPQLNEYEAAHRALVAFNTIVDVNGPHLGYGTGFGSRDRTVLPADVVVANNAFVAGGFTSGQAVTDEEPISVTFTGNVISDREVGFGIASGFTPVIDAGLVKDGAGIFRPVASSVLIDAAQGEFATVTLDLDGTARSGAKDVGADERNGLASVWAIRTAANTGPSWLGPKRVIPGGRMANIATRAFAGVGDEVLTGGFVIDGTSRRVLIRGVGPTLAGFGVGGTLADPVLKVFPGGSGVAIYENDNWGESPLAAEIASRANELGAFALASGSDDAAILVTLTPGPYTVQLSSANGGTGVALIEVYEVR